MALNTARNESLSRSPRASSSPRRVLVRQLMSYSRCKKENQRGTGERERERSGETSYRYESATGYLLRTHSFTSKQLLFSSFFLFSLSPSLIVSTVSHYYFTVFVGFPRLSFAAIRHYLHEMNPALKRATGNVNGSYSALWTLRNNRVPIMCFRLCATTCTSWIDSWLKYSIRVVEKLDRSIWIVENFLILPLRFYVVIIKFRFDVIDRLNLLIL